MEGNTPVFGVPHAKFDQLKDASGNLVPPAKACHVYNAFIDFHALCDVFSEKINGANSIQDLHHLGDKIQHAASNTKAPVNLGSNIADSSYFQNGEVTLELKGMSVVRNRVCAPLEYDSSESSFFMKIQPMPGMDITTKGRPRCLGDLNKDSKSSWLLLATLHEYVVSETRLPFEPKKISAVAERRIMVKNTTP